LPIAGALRFSLTVLPDHIHSCCPSVAAFEHEARCAATISASLPWCWIRGWRRARCRVPGRGALLSMTASRMPSRVTMMKRHKLTNNFEETHWHVDRKSEGDFFTPCHARVRWLNDPRYSTKSLLRQPVGKVERARNKAAVVIAVRSGNLDVLKPPNATC